MRLSSAALLATVLVLSACNRQEAKPAAPAPQAAPPPPAALPAPVPAPEPQLSGFSHAPGLNLFGYYLAKAPVQFGNHRLRNVHLGAPEEFDSYEKGQRISAAYAPLMLEFDDITSPKRENELGQPYYEISRRVLPSAYRVTGQTVSFRGRDAVLGDVTFEGQFDAKALERVRAGGADEPVLSGVIVAMGQSVSRSFVWFGGD